MILKTITIQNFRQYYGVQELEIATDKEKNVTVIHGENGEGKTAFLNIIKWCLYERCYLPDPQRLLNEKAEAELVHGESISVRVEITFLDNGQTYTATRIKNYEKIDLITRVCGNFFSVKAINEDGKSIPYDNPQNTINQVLPEKMESYFFFDGEKIDNLTKKESSGDIKQAIKNIMGIEAIENAIEDLGKATKALRKDFSQFSNNTEIQKDIEKLESVEKKLNTEKVYKLQFEKNKKALYDQKEKTYQKLRELDGAKELQSQRDRLENELKIKKSKLIQANNVMKDIYSSKGYLSFSLNLIEKVGLILETRRKKGEIPAGIKEQFVDDILERKVCICERELVENTVPYNSVKSWKKKSGNKKLEDSFIQISADLKNLAKERDNLFLELEKVKKEKQELQSERKKVEEELDEISTKLDGKESEDIIQLENKRKEIEELIEKENKLIYQKETNIENLEIEKSSLEKKVSTATSTEEKAQKSKKRLNASEEALSTLDEILEITIETVRVNLQQKIEKVFSKFSKKGYKSILNNSFELQIIKENDPLKRCVPMSQGERQIASLSFIGALVDIARERKGRESQFFKGGEYPIVMDSPFGALDPVHKTNIANGMPDLSHQIIILVTNSQWKGEVEASILHRVGKEYQLINYNPKKDVNIKYEYTHIKEV